MTRDAGSEIAEDLSPPDIRPNLIVLLFGLSAIALMSVLVLPWPLALASALLGALMIAGTDVDARTFLLPDVVTYGATASGIFVAPFIDVQSPWVAVGHATLRASATALALFGIREAYRRARGREGLGLGDVKLAAAIGAWLPLQAIPYCFSIASAAALLFVIIRRREEANDSMKIPFGAFLCPALWLVFFLSAVMS